MRSSPSPDATGDADEPREDMLKQIRAEIKDVKAITAAFGIERIR